MTFVLPILLALAPHAVSLSVEPWTGADFQTTGSIAAKYRLEVDGTPNATVRLRAVGVAQGWLAAFCTPQLCSPAGIETRLSRNGGAVLQFELIRESANAPPSSGAVITDGDGASIAVPAAVRQ